MLDSFTYVEHDKLAKAIDDYEDNNVNHALNKLIRQAENARTQKSWFRRRNLTLDESLDAINHAGIHDWSGSLSWKLNIYHSQAEELRRLLKSGNGAYIGARDSYILTYIT